MYFQKPGRNSENLEEILKTWMKFSKTWKKYPKNLWQCLSKQSKTLLRFYSTAQNAFIK